MVQVGASCQDQIYSNLKLLTKPFPKVNEGTRENPCDLTEWTPENTPVGLPDRDVKYE
jgi:hypothetical protein